MQLDDGWNLTKPQWELMSKCNKCARQLFPVSRSQQEAWARSAYLRCQAEGVTPEVLRDRRAPGVAELYRRRKPNISHYID